MWLRTLSIMLLFSLNKSFYKTNKNSIGSIFNILKKEKCNSKQFIIQSKKNNNKEFSGSASFATPPLLKTIQEYVGEAESKTKPIRETLKSTKETKEFKPKGPNQELYFKYLNDPNTDIVLGVGPAGSGKTLFACYVAIQELLKGNIQKIIMTRPLISVDKEDIGFLPGNLVSKMDPWTKPMFDILSEFFNQKKIKDMIQTGIIEISPLAYMRGRTFKNAFIIADEMQNSSPNQMLMITTRIGEGTKMVITGDIKQSDREDENGLLDFMNKIKKNNMNSFNESNKNMIKLVELNSKDIERSQVVKKVLKMYEFVGEEESKTYPIRETLESKTQEFVGEEESQTELRRETLNTKNDTKNDMKNETKEVEIKNDCAMIPLNQYKINYL